MDINVLFAIKNLKIESDDNIDKVTFNWDEFSLSNDLKYKKEAFFTKELEELIGEIHSKQLFSKLPYAYKRIEIADQPSSNSLVLEVMKEVGFRSNAISGVLSFFWFVRDNAIATTAGVGYIPGLRETYVVGGTHSISTCVGDTQIVVSFSVDEIKEVSEICSKYCSVCASFVAVKENMDSLPLSEDMPIRDVVLKGLPSHIHYNEYNRIERAIIFLSMARHKSHLPHKISLYVPIFECLFSNDSEEVSFKISIKAASYLNIKDATIPVEQTFKDIRAAYNVRSRFLHGDKLNKKKSGKKTKPYTEDDLKQIAETTDGLLRKLLKNVIMVDAKSFLEEDEEVFDDFLNSFIFKSKSRN